MQPTKFQPVASHRAIQSSVADLTGMSRATIWRKVKDDATFPKPFRLSDAITVWDEDEILAWIKTKKAVRGVPMNPTSPRADMIEDQHTLPSSNPSATASPMCQRLTPESFGNCQAATRRRLNRRFFIMRKSKTRIAEKRMELPSAEQFKGLSPVGQMLAAMGVLPDLTFEKYDGGAAQLIAVIDRNSQSRRIEQ